MALEMEGPFSSSSISSSNSMASTQWDETTHLLPSRRTLDGVQKPHGSADHPPRQLGVAAVGTLAFFCVAGSTFGTEDLVGAAGPGWTLLGFLLIPFVWSVPCALMTAELCSAMPEDGGPPVWVSKAFGRFWGFQEGIWLWVMTLIDNALYPVMFADYLENLTGQLSYTHRLLACLGLIVVVCCVNVLGVQVAGKAAIVLCFISVCPFLVLFVMGLKDIQPSVWVQSKENVNWSLFFSVLMWNNCGWDNSATFAGEVKEPVRSTYFWGLVLAVTLVSSVYLLPLTVMVCVNQDWNQWHEGSFPHLAEALGGSWLRIWLTATGCVAATGQFNSLCCASSRIAYSMAEKRMLPRIMGTLHPRFLTPWVAILFGGVLCLVLIVLPWQTLIQLDMCLHSAVIFMEVLSLVRLRISHPDLPRPFRIPLSTWPLVVCYSPVVVFAVATLVMTSGLAKLMGASVMALGVLAYFLFLHRRAYDFELPPKSTHT
eukprot:GILJ01007751.1.p1 GENE.GILJ01007751.1~~GILJ01007751.1.p1  ORF type:complete len:512 (-),score=45.41 GILJ01007751.1:227-1681(-)